MKRDVSSVLEKRGQECFIDVAIAAVVLPVECHLLEANVPSAAIWCLTLSKLSTPNWNKEFSVNNCEQCL